MDVQILGGLSLMALLSSACGPLGAQVSYQPLGLPVEITIDTWGEISLSTEGVTDLPTPLGTFGVGVVVDPTIYVDTSAADIQTTLTVRENDAESFYDMNDQQINRINFEPGYYQVLSLSWRAQGRDLLLEMERLKTLNDDPTAQLENTAEVPAAKVSDDFLCGPTAFTKGMSATAVQAVNLRSSPEVPPDWGSNWNGTTLQVGEKVAVIEEPEFRDGYWLNVRRESGEEGWVKECTPQNGILVAPE